LILGPILTWLILPFLAVLLLLIQKNQGFRLDLFKSLPVEVAEDFNRPGRLGRLIRLAYLRTFADPALFPGRRLTGLERKYAALRVRRIYTRLLKLSAEAGYIFHPSLSSLGILQALSRHFPAIKEDLATIVESYTRLVFGEVPERQYQLDAVERSWLKVQAYAITGWRSRTVKGWCHDQPGSTCS
jgi:hypothetical protein